ncbi:hypothetical protein Tco_0908552 [Tanacetum coccineum]|uniref:CCHC-type domain-containing protein n=1 Tax=Tanacetum coccineum TaxID=301880 RepID=A0ABQ5CQA5_9ASTR
MASHRLNSLYAIKECMTCGSLYTRECCSIGSLENKILVPEPDSSPCCAKCGTPVDGPYCRGCALLRKKVEEDLLTYCGENETSKDFKDISESSDDNTNVVNAPREPIVVNQDPGEKSSQGPPLINQNCCYECGDSLDGIFCQQCICKFCGKGAHYGYNCPPKVPIISNLEQCNQTIAELPQTLPIVYPTCKSGDKNSFTYDSKPHSFNDSPSILTHPPQLQFETYLCELCGNNAHYGYDCSPQFPFVYEHEPHYCEQNSCYDPNSFGFDQYQPPQFPVNYPPQETSREILQTQEALMEATQAFLKVYDHIPPNEKCMALLLAEERFLKIKQAMREEQNQPEVMQELLLKLIDDLQSLKGSQKEKKETAAQSFIPYWNVSMIDNEEASDNFLKDERYGKIKDALMDKQYQQEDIQELMSKLLEDDDDEYTVIWRRSKAITPDLPIEEPDNSLNMGDEHLDTVPATESDEVIKSSVENLSDLMESLINCDSSIVHSSKIDPILEEFACKLAHIAPISPEIVKADFDPNDDTSSDDDSSENIEYIDASPSYIKYDSFEKVNDVEQKEKEFDLEDIFQIQDIEPDQGRLTSVVIADNSNGPLLELPEFESFHFNPSFPRPPPEPPDVEKYLEPEAGLTQQFLKTLVSGVVSRFTRASHPLFEISLGRSDILSSYRFTFIFA